MRSGCPFPAERDTDRQTTKHGARYEVEQHDGDIAFEIGHYAWAEEHYQAAMTIAEELDYQEGVAKTSTALAWIYILRRQPEIRVLYQQSRSQL